MDALPEEERRLARTAWDIYFASVCAMCLHPGNREFGMSIAECAKLADEMLHERLARCRGL